MKERFKLYVKNAQTQNRRLKKKLNEILVRRPIQKLDRAFQHKNYPDCNTLVWIHYIHIFYII